VKESAEKLRKRGREDGEDAAEKQIEESSAKKQKIAFLLS